MEKWLLLKFANQEGLSSPILRQLPLFARQLDPKTSPEDICAALLEKGNDPVQAAFGYMRGKMGRKDVEEAWKRIKKYDEPRFSYLNVEKQEEFLQLPHLEEALDVYCEGK